jgi:hypothetical protein
MKDQKSINIIKIDKEDNGQIKIYPSTYKNMLFEYVYRTASGVRWNEELNCFYKYEAKRWEDVDFILNTIDCVRSEYNIFLTIDENTQINNLLKDSTNRLLNKYFDLYIIGKDNYQFVYVNNDGTIREVSLSERIYLQTKYHEADGDRPYIKSNYKQTTPDNRINGYCFRNKIPNGMNIKSDKIGDNIMKVIDEIQRVFSMGYEIDYSGIGFVRLMISA